METGLEYELTHIAGEDETAEKMGSGRLPVFATPAMICLMEKTACELALSRGEDTVGTRLEISHLKACLPGTELRCRAKVAAVEGRKIVFDVQVTAKEETIGKGIHERFVIDPVKFMSKLY